VLVLLLKFKSELRPETKRTWSKKSKAVPATRHGGAWGDRRYSPSSFLTAALDGGEWSASRPSRALPPEKGPPVHILQEAGWAPEPVWTQRLQDKSSVPVGDRTPVVQSVVRHYTDWATPAPEAHMDSQNISLGTVTGGILPPPSQHPDRVCYLLSYGYRRFFPWV
jgi:hypothetical protein